jgi:CHASE2 domain-containing sensor protein
MFAYDVLLWQLPSFEPENLPVVVVDISRKSTGDQPTPRDFLESLITAIADKNPRGIAVDIDFSPKEDDWVTPGDPKFFNFCLDITRNKTPLFLGVGRAKADPPDTWLGLLKYQELAAAIAIDKQDQRRIPVWIQSGGGTKPLKSMSVLLAEVYGEPLPTPPRGLGWLLKHDSEAQHEVRDRDSSFSYAERVVNYSKFEQIYHERLPTISPTSVDEFSDRFANKLVIIGDPVNAADAVSIPGTQQVVGGVFVHANAVYTLVNEPFYEFKDSSRIAIDFLISLAIALVVGIIRWRNPEQPELSRKTQSRTVKAFVFSIIPAGIIFFYLTHVLWLDFLLVLFALLLHPTVEDVLSATLKKLGAMKAKVQKTQLGGSS